MYFLSHRNDIIVVFTVYILRYMWVPLKGPGPVLDLDGKGTCTKLYFNIQSLNIMSSWSVGMVFRSLETIQTLPYSALSTPLDNPLLIPALSSTHSHQHGETIGSLRHTPLFHPCCCLFRPA